MKNIIIFTLLIMSLLWTGCSDEFLEKYPESNYTGESYYSSDEAVLKACEPLYGRAWFNFNRRAILGIGSYRANDAWNPYASAEFARFQTTALTDEVQQAWSSLYTVVTMSNSILHDIVNYATDNVTEEAKNKAMGECYLMRGAAYFYMVRIWGPVILFETNDNVILVPQQPLNPEEDVFRFIIRDLRKASELLPETMVEGRASRYSAKALLAKVLLAHSGWNNTSRDENDLQECIKLCEEVIDKSGAFLIDYENLFKYQYNLNNETLLAMQFASPISGGWGECNALVSDLSFSEVCDVNCWGNNLTPSIDLIEYYNEDPSDVIRLKATFFTENRHYDYIKSASGGYTYNRKWMQVKKGVVGSKEDNDGNLYQMRSPLNTDIIRLADVLLTHAEACLGDKEILNGGRGLESFNKVRERAGVRLFTEITFDDIIRERRIEFCMEYSNWFDMVSWYRWKPNYMLDYFNNKQHRGYELQEGSVELNNDNTFRYWIQNWYDSNGNKYWSDALREDNDEQTIIQGKADGYVFDITKLSDEEGFSRIKVDDANIFIPYPESDALQNPYLSQEPQPYNFSNEE